MLKRSISFCPYGAIRSARMATTTMMASTITPAMASLARLNRDQASCQGDRGSRLEISSSRRWSGVLVSTVVAAAEVDSLSIVAFLVVLDARIEQPVDQIRYQIAEHD